MRFSFLLFSLSLVCQRENCEPLMSSMCVVYVYVCVCCFAKLRVVSEEKMESRRRFLCRTSRQKDCKGDVIKAVATRFERYLQCRSHHNSMQKSSTPKTSPVKLRFLLSTVSCFLSFFYFFFLLGSRALTSVQRTITSVLRNHPQTCMFVRNKKKKKTGEFVGETYKKETKKRCE